jgi:hypothetical protein
MRKRLHRARAAGFYQYQRREHDQTHMCFFFLMLMHYDTKSDIYHKVWAMGRHEANRGRAGSPMRNDTVHFSTT